MYEFKTILFDQDVIAAKSRELAGLISRDYSGQALVLVCILKGAVAFTVDLMRNISCAVSVEFVQAASYGSTTRSSGNVIIRKSVEIDVTGKHVILVDTIIDTGETLDCFFKKFTEQKPASLRAAVLLDKKARRTVEVPLAYVGFEIPDLFVVGYGMDHAENYRNLPYIAVLASGNEE